MVRQAGRFVADEAAGTAIMFALILPVLIAAGGAAVDYSFALMTQTKMKALPNSAALASVRELQLARTDSSRITAIANNVVNSLTSGRDDNDQCRLSSHDGPGHHPRSNTRPSSAIWSKTNLQASATAKMSGSMPLCLLGLDPTAPQTIGLEQSALLTAPGCLVQSNSTSTSRHCNRSRMPS